MAQTILFLAFATWSLLSSFPYPFHMFIWKGSVFQNGAQSSLMQHASPVWRQWSSTEVQDFFPLTASFSYNHGLHVVFLFMEPSVSQH